MTTDIEKIKGKLDSVAASLEAGDVHQAWLDYTLLALDFGALMHLTQFVRGQQSILQSDARTQAAAAITGLRDALAAGRVGGGVVVTDAEVQ